MNAIFKRGSVRDFTQQPVSRDDIIQLLKAAMQAPSAGNEQPWEFVVLQQREVMLKVTEFHPYAKMLDRAGCAIVVCGDTAKQKFGYDFWIQDCAAATQNILLEATELGLGGVWLAIYPVEERVAGMRALLGLPETVVPLCAVAVGHPAAPPEPGDRYLQDRVHFEKW